MLFQIQTRFQKQKSENLFNSSLGNVAITGTFTGAPNTAIYSTITAAIDAGIAFSIALG